MLDLSQEQIRAVVSMYLMGISHFDADHPQADALGQLFCFAAREVLEEEKVGSGKPRSEILADIARQARPQVLPETYEAFCSLQEDEFDRLLQPVLDETEESGVSARNCSQHSRQSTRSSTISCSLRPQTRVFRTSQIRERVTRLPGYSTESVECDACSVPIMASPTGHRRRREHGGRKC